uniref:Uncharacterized protein n=1 Tax=Panagrolaimus sp. ES5 TaxID=591445 RepID=A0AC34FFH8_9BILA
MAGISKKKQALKAASFASAVKRNERKSTTTQKEAPSTINQIISEVNESPEDTFQKVQVEDGTINKLVDPQKSFHGLKLVKNRIDKENKKKERLESKLKHARRAKAKKNDDAKEMKESESDDENESMNIKCVSNLINVADFSSVPCSSNASRLSDVPQTSSSSPSFNITTFSGFNYTPQTTARAKPSNPNSEYRKRKVLQKQLDGIMPDYEIVKKAKILTIDEEAKLVKTLKLSRSTINAMSKAKKLPSYPTIKKYVDKAIPEVPRYQIPDTEKRKNVICLHFYELILARLKNMKHIPSRILRVTISADTGEKTTKIRLYH